MKKILNILKEILVLVFICSFVFFLIVKHPFKTEAKTTNIESKETNIITCDHQWIKGAFYIIAAKDFDETISKKPSKYIQIEYCVKCGLIRLPKEYIGYQGEDLGE